MNALQGVGGVFAVASVNGVSRKAAVKSWCFGSSVSLRLSFRVELWGKPANQPNLKMILDH